ncbi:STAS domain-containing protein [Streptomyces sp. NPDC058045]|uniref:STAS domain-containing protein n=1 Tax=Streptomyces sp. NPDC058045 TaxID=3346311 RepID=UPI0036E4EF20
MHENRQPHLSGLRERHSGSTTVVELYGEFDVAAAAPARRHLDVLTAYPDTDLVLDLTAVTFIDCSGLSVLCRVRNRIRHGGGRLRLVVPGRGVRRLLRCTGLAGSFEVLPRLPRPLTAAGIRA